VTISNPLHHHVQRRLYSIDLASPNSILAWTRAGELDGIIKKIEESYVNQLTISLAFKLVEL